MNRKKKTALFVVLFAVLLQVPAPAALAHNSEYYRSGPVTISPSHCVSTAAGQNHGSPTYPNTWSRYVITTLKVRQPNMDSIGVPCALTNYYQPYGWIHQRGVIYKNGNFCLAGGWVFNTTYTAQLSTWVADDIWPSCNYGPGVYVNITNDYYHESWAGNNYGYWITQSQTPFPTTSHCHCP